MSPIIALITADSPPDSPGTWSQRDPELWRFSRQMGAECRAGRSRQVR